MLLWTVGKPPKPAGGGFHFCYRSSFFLERIQLWQRIHQQALPPWWCLRYERPGRWTGARRRCNQRWCQQRSIPSRPVQQGGRRAARPRQGRPRPRLDDVWCPYLLNLDPGFELMLNSIFLWFFFLKHTIDINIRKKWLLIPFFFLRLKNRKYRKDSSLSLQTVFVQSKKKKNFLLVPSYMKSRSDLKIAIGLVKYINLSIDQWLFFFYSYWKLLRSPTQRDKKMNLKRGNLFVKYVPGTVNNYFSNFTTKLSTIFL